MGEILVLLGELLANLVRNIALTVAVNSATSYIQSLLKGSQGGSSWVQLSNEVGTSLAEIESATYGLSVLHAQISTLSAAMAIDVTAILTAIGTPQQVGSPVTLPGAVPGGWSLPTTSDVGSWVWGYAVPPTGSAAANLLTLAYYVARNLDEGGSFQIPGSPYFLVTGWANSSLGNLDPAQAPQPDVGAILPTDTLETWLTRELAGWTIMPGYWGGTEIAVQGGSGSSLTYTCTLDDDTFALLQGSRIAPSALPPVWPGLAAVTLGTPVALDSVVTVAVPCDGCLIHITGAPTKQGQFVFGGLVSYRNAGGLSFVTDDGEAEFPQLLGFTDAVYCPRSMAHAAGLVLRASPGVTGTVTPWTLA